jgi:hypothetical protein
LLGVTVAKPRNFIRKTDCSKKVGIGKSQSQNYLSKLENVCRLYLISAICFKFVKSIGMTSDRTISIHFHGNQAQPAVDSNFGINNFLEGNVGVGFVECHGFCPPKRQQVNVLGKMNRQKHRDKLQFR